MTDGRRVEGSAAPEGSRGASVPVNRVEVSESMMRSRRLVARVGVAIALAASAAGVASCGSSETGAASNGGGKTVWRHGIIKAKGDAEFTALLAAERGFFAKHGVDVKISEFEGSLQLTQALLAGQIDSAENNADPVIRALAQGADVTAIGSTIPVAAYNLYSKRTFSDLKSLQGKTLGVSKPGAFPDLVTKALLSTQDVDYKSIKLVNAGDDATRYRALIAGRVDATAASTEFAPQAQRDGVHVIAEAAKLLPQWPRFIVWANPESLKSKPDAAVGMMAGLIEGLNFALDNKQQAIEFAAKTLKLPADDTRLSYTYDVQSALASRTAEVPVDKLQFVADKLVELGESPKAVDVSAHVDTSFQERAIAKTGGS
jgi:NitT/TauT family transport system substrate-binding protein